MKKSRSHAWKEWEQKAWQEVLAAIRSSDSEKGARLLDTLLAENEKALIAKRMAALILLRQGKTYREIGAALRMSPITISALKKTAAEQRAYRSTHQYAAAHKKEKLRRIRASLPPAPTALDYFLQFPTKVGKGRWKFLDFP